VLRRHHTAEADGASDPERDGSDAQVPDTDPEPTELVEVHAEAAETGHATTVIAFARAALPEATEATVE
jgi:hypothetical protein